jgi:predicted nucleic acid-binding protein
MTTYALDTNIISFILRGNAGIIRSYQKANDAGQIFIIPAIVYYEIRRGLLAVGATAQCIVNGYTLVTDNASDFERVDGLHFIEWDKD